ncbi:MAG: ATP synthase subunit b [Parcubacteria group bacterium GW2011_GWA2_47_9]|nr:MAG: ATP synthase subunit b [Parcubacteria group bacterium GW2011_GWA2_47_9]
MSELFHQLGVDWKLLLSQGVNFLILLAVLTFVLFRPLLKVLEERKKKIELGLKVGKEAEERLLAIDKMKEEKLGEAEKMAFEIVKKGEAEAKAGADKIIIEGGKKADDILKEAGQIAERRQEEARLAMAKEAKTLVRAAIIKTVQLDPNAVDAALVSQAVDEISGLSAKISRG